MDDEGRHLMRLASEHRDELDAEIAALRTERDRAVEVADAATKGVYSKYMLEAADAVSESRYQKRIINELRAALRSHVIGHSYSDDESFKRDEALRGYCIACSHSWPAFEDESHARDCLAALNTDASSEAGDSTPRDQHAASMDAGNADHMDRKP